jgi:hypothetical protein
MFGHLKPEEFVNAMEADGSVSARLSKTRLEHLESCSWCAAQLRSLEAVRGDLAMEDSEIPEPDWNTFRDSVRMELLSRSIQRETAVRRWTGWSIRPTMAWALSLVLLLVVSAGFFWHVRQDDIKTSSVATQEMPAPVDSADVETLPAWTGSGVFQQLSSLEEPQMERLQILLESAQNNGVMNRQ